MTGNRTPEKAKIICPPTPTHPPPWGGHDDSSSLVPANMPLSGIFPLD